MTVTTRLGQPMLAAMFISGGTDQLLHPEEKAEAAATVVEDLEGQLDEQVPLRDEPTTLVRVNGAVQVAAGTLLAFNKAPRLAAAALAGSLIPTTIGAHRFWEADEETKQQQQIHFLKNMAMLGGLFLAMGNTNGRASMPRRARRKVRRSAATVADSVSGASDAVATNLSSSVDSVRGAVGSRAADVSATAAGAGARMKDLTSNGTTRAARARDLVRDVAPMVRNVRDDAAQLAQAATKRGRKTVKKGRKAYRQAVA